MSWGGSASSKAKESKSHGSLSKETEQLLDSVMKQRGLSIRASKEVKESIQNGAGDPFQVFSAKAAQTRQPLNSKVATASIPKPPPTSTLQALGSPPARFSNIRLKEDIERINGPLDQREQYVPLPPMPSREEQKDKLSNIMSHGNARAAREAQMREAEMREEAALKKAEEERRLSDPKEALIAQIFDEIAERREFLEGLVSKGLASNPKITQVKGEISARMSELQKLGIDTRPGRPTKPKPMDPSRVRIG